MNKQKLFGLLLACSLGAVLLAPAQFQDIRRGTGGGSTTTATVTNAVNTINGDGTANQTLELNFANTNAPGTLTTSGGTHTFSLHTNIADWARWGTNIIGTLAGSITTQIAAEAQARSDADTAEASARHTSSQNLSNIVATLASTAQLNAASNYLYGLINSGGITASEGTNIARFFATNSSTITSNALLSVINTLSNNTWAALSYLTNNSGGSITTNMHVAWITNLFAVNATFDQFNATTLVISNWLSTSGPFTNAGPTYLTDIDGTGRNLHIAADGKLSRTNITASGGSSSFTESNLVISSTNNTLLDVGSFDRFTVRLLTNATLTFTNASSLAKRARVVLQQDTNGQRSVAWANAGGLLQTNASLVVTTNANALDLLEVEPSLFSSNLLVWWPQNFLPRVAFTNDLAGGGGGGGGGDYTNNLTLWVNADHLGLTEGAAIASFTESSPSNRTFYSQNADAVYRASAVNGHAAIEVDGARGFTNANAKAGFFADAGNNKVTMFALLKQTGAIPNNQLFMVPDVDSGSQLVLYATYIDTFYWDAPQASARVSAAQPVDWDDGWHVLQVMRDGATSIIVVDGVVIASGTGLSGNFSSNSGTFWLFGQYGVRWAGQLAELRIYNEAISISNSNSVFTALKTKGGL